MFTYPVWNYELYDAHYDTNHNILLYAIEQLNLEIRTTICMQLAVTCAIYHLINICIFATLQEWSTSNKLIKFNYLINETMIWQYGLITPLSHMRNLARAYWLWGISISSSALSGGNRLLLSVRTSTSVADELLYTSTVCLNAGIKKIHYNNYQIPDPISDWIPDIQCIPTFIIEYWYIQ